MISQRDSAPSPKPQSSFSGGFPAGCTIFYIARHSTKVSHLNLSTVKPNQSSKSSRHRHHSLPFLPNRTKKKRPHPPQETGASTLPSAPPSQQQSIPITADDQHTMRTCLGECLRRTRCAPVLVVSASERGKGRGEGLTTLSCRHVRSLHISPVAVRVVASRAVCPPSLMVSYRILLLDLVVKMGWKVDC